MPVLKSPKVDETPLRANRFASITKAPFSLNGISLRWLRGEDRLGEPFRYRLKFISKDPIRNMGQIPGEKITAGMLMSDRKTIRYFNGIISDFEFTGIQDNRRLNYEVELRPWLWLLGLRRNSRIFHKKTSLEIIRKIFGEHGGNFQVKVRGQLPRRIICVQYEETDLDFVSRLMEQDGLYYFFEHSATDHTLILADDPSDHKPCKPEKVLSQLNLRSFRYKEDMIWQWHERVSLTPGRVSLRDYDYEKPKSPLDALEPVPDALMGDVRGTMPTRTAGGAGSRFAGKSSARTAPRNTDLRETFHYPGEYLTRENGAFYAKRQAEEIASKAYRIKIEGSMRQVTVGCSFRAENPYDQPDMSKIPDPSHNWLAVGVAFEITGEVGDNVETEDPEGGVFLYRAEVEAQSAATPFRPERRTPWPRIIGPQTAEVDGPPGTQIATDKLGRLRVRFHWDREGANPASGWIRVVQSWAGKGFGGLVTPRVGQEVVVHFHDGNPDRPIITGAVYNEANQPAERLPANASRSAFRTRSTPGTSRSYNELRFEDAAGSEEVLLRAERDYNLKVKDTHRVNVDKRYVLQAGLPPLPTNSLFEITPTGIRMIVKGPTGTQGIEINPKGITLLGTTVGIFSRTTPVAAFPYPIPAPPQLRVATEVAMSIPPRDTKVDE